MDKQVEMKSVFIQSNKKDSTPDPSSPSTVIDNSNPITSSSPISSSMGFPPSYKGISYDQLVDDYIARNKKQAMFIEGIKYLVIIVGTIMISVFSVKGNIDSLQSNVSLLQNQNAKLLSSLQQSQTTASLLGSQLASLQNDYNAILVLQLSLIMLLFIVIWFNLELILLLIKFLI